MYWIILAVLLVVLVVLFFKAKHFKHGLGSYFLVFIMIFLIASTSYVYLTNDVDLTTFDGLVNCGKVYFSWLGGVFHNTKQITAYAVKQDWSANSSVG